MAREKKHGIKLPDKHIKIGENMCAFMSINKGVPYLNLRKMYEDDFDDLCMGKGLTILPEDFEYILEAIPEIEKLIGDN